MSDPSGRHPLTDAEFASWRDSHRTGLAAVGDRVTACDPVTGEALAHTVTATAPTGRTQRVYSFEVDGLQAYYVRTGTTFIAVHNECSELARQLQQRAQQLNDARGGWSPKYGTTAVIQAQAEIDGKTVITTFVATNSKYSEKPIRDMLREGVEEFVTGKGHAEDTILRHLDEDKYTWRVIAGGTSRNVCRGTCAPCVEKHGLELTGPEFRGRADKTPYRMFQIPGLGH